MKRVSIERALKVCGFTEEVGEWIGIHEIYRDLLLWLEGRISVEDVREKVKEARLLLEEYIKVEREKVFSRADEYLRKREVRKVRVRVL